MNINENANRPSDADMEWYLSTTYVDPSERPDVLAPVDPWDATLDLSDPAVYRAAMDAALDAARVSSFHVDDYHEGPSDTFDAGYSDYLSDMLAG